MPIQMVNEMDKKSESSKNTNLNVGRLTPQLQKVTHTKGEGRRNNTKEI